MERPSKDEYFLEIASVVAKRSTCMRRHVGAVVVREGQILSTGYNGAPSGMEHCEDVGCVRAQQNIPPGERHELCRGVHAEQNAIIQAAIHGVSIEGATVYLTCQPCILCTKMLINSKIKRIVYAGEYPDKMSMEFLKSTGMDITIINKLDEKSIKAIEEGRC